MIDLWPEDLGTTATASPLTILKEQASLLGAKTKNILKAGVTRYERSPAVISRNVVAAKSAAVADEPFKYAFYLEAPALDNYTYRLFTAAYDVNLYPVRLAVDDDIASELGTFSGLDLIASDEEEFKQLLSKILASQKTRKVVNAILSQSTDSAPGGLT
jgi:hypothetical protein